MLSDCKLLLQKDTATRKPSFPETGNGGRLSWAANESFSDSPGWWRILQASHTKWFGLSLVSIFNVLRPNLGPMAAPPSTPHSALFGANGGSGPSMDGPPFTDGLTTLGATRTLWILTHLLLCDRAVIIREGSVSKTSWHS